MQSGKVSGPGPEPAGARPGTYAAISQTLASATSWTWSGGWAEAPLDLRERRGWPGHRRREGRAAEPPPRAGPAPSALPPALLTSDR